MKTVNAIIGAALVALTSGCMPQRARVMHAAENQAWAYASSLGCGLAGHSSKYLEKRGEIHAVLVCGFAMLCKKDDVDTADGYTCVDASQAPASWRDGGSATQASVAPASGGPPAAASATSIGTNGAACYGNGTCNNGLTCAFNQCVVVQY